MSSLCSVAEVNITTRTKDQNSGTSLSYDKKGLEFFGDPHLAGILVKQIQAACRPGTTVAFRDLFKPLPVRHQEFIRGIKKDFGRLQDVIQAYAIIQSDKRFIVFHQDKKRYVTTYYTLTSSSNRRRILHTPGNTDMRTNIASIFGARFLQNMDPIRGDNPDCLYARVPVYLPIFQELKDGYRALSTALASLLLKTNICILTSARWICQR